MSVVDYLCFENDSRCLAGTYDDRLDFRRVAARLRNLGFGHRVTLSASTLGSRTTVNPQLLGRLYFAQLRDKLRPMHESNVRSPPPPEPALRQAARSRIHVKG